MSAGINSDLTCSALDAISITMYLSGVAWMYPFVGIYTLSSCASTLAFVPSIKNPVTYYTFRKYPCRKTCTTTTGCYRGRTEREQLNNDSSSRDVLHTRIRRSRVQMPRMVLDPEVEPASLGEFHDWLNKAGVKLNDLFAQVARSPLNGGRGLIATKRIEKGAAVVAIPQSLGLTAGRLSKSGIANFIKGYDGWTGDTGLIALQILWEMNLGEQSSIAPWINVLPPPGELDLPLFWDEFDLALADTSSTRGISGFRADVDEDYRWLQQNVFDKNPNVFSSDKFGLANFRWAVAIALSRSFFVDGELRLTPLVDFANHQSARDTLEPTGGSTGGLFGSTKAVILRAGRAYDEGEEFFVSYGPKGAAGYLEENGFVPPLSGSEVTCELEFSVPTDDRFLDDKEDILEQQAIGTTATFDLTSSGLPDSELIRFLRLCYLEGMDTFLLESVFRSDIWSFMELPVSRTNEEAVNKALAERCQAELNRFHGSAEEDEAIVAGKNEVTHRERLCATVRRGERLALQMTKKWCETDSAALDRKEYYQERRLRELQLDLPLEDDEIQSYDRQAGRAGRDLDW